MQQLRTVRLYGRLGATFGRSFQFVLESNTTAEAISALCSQIPGFRSYLAKAKDRGMAFTVFVGERNLSKEDLSTPSGASEIRIAPVILGSKRAGTFQVILGVVLIIVGAVMNYFAPGSGVGVMKWGAVLAIGGLAQMLSPQPKGLKNGDRPNNQPSYVFNGAINTQAQGNPVPLLYGRMIVGSAVVSAGIDAADYAPAGAGVGYGTPGGSFKKNFYED